MKLTIKYLTIFLLCTFFTCAQAESFKLNYETISASETGKNPKYQNLKQFDSGHHKTIIRISDLPDSERFELLLKRPLFQTTETIISTKKDLLEKAFLIGEKDPILTISSLGYLPGEEIIVTFRAKDKDVLYDSINITPNPIKKKSRQQGFSVEIKMISVSPTSYELIIEGVKEGTNFGIYSTSYGETSTQDYQYSKKLPHIIYLKPERGHGGATTVMVCRSNQDFLEVLLPWGSELEYHRQGARVPVTRLFESIRYQRN
ncbi:MAG: hypothetical protein KDK56_07275 [Simkania sp.]|nr:hypothetical protein [Simkania sp.]MCB9092514.1 hypothetical protein [Halobacteriovoraceae bacterium]